MSVHNGFPFRSEGYVPVATDDDLGGWAARGSAVQEGLHLGNPGVVGATGVEVGG
jgi:hypothetical protein